MGDGISNNGNKPVLRLVRSNGQPVDFDPDVDWPEKKRDPSSSTTSYRGKKGYKSLREILTGMSALERDSQAKQTQAPIIPLFTPVRTPAAVTTASTGLEARKIRPLFPEPPPSESLEEWHGWPAYLRQLGDHLATHPDIDLTESEINSLQRVIDGLDLSMVPYFTLLEDHARALADFFSLRRVHGRSHPAIFHTALTWLVPQLVMHTNFSPAQFLDRDNPALILQAKLLTIPHGDPVAHVFTTSQQGAKHALLSLLQQTQTNRFQQWIFHLIGAQQSLNPDTVRAFLCDESLSDQIMQRLGRGGMRFETHKSPPQRERIFRKPPGWRTRVRRTRRARSHAHAQTAERRRCINRSLAAKMQGVNYFRTTKSFGRFLFKV